MLDSLIAQTRKDFQAIIIDSGLWIGKDDTISLAMNEIFLEYKDYPLFEWFFSGEPRPWIVNYVEDRDLWRHRLHASKLVNAYLSTVEFSFEAWDKSLDIHPDGNIAQRQKWDTLLVAGSAVLARTEQYVVEIAKNAIRVQFEGFDVPLVNAPQMDISDLLGHLAQGEPFAMGWFQRADGIFQYSLRSRGEGSVDVAELARRHGGGGHAQAAGFPATWPVHLPRRP